MCLIVPKDTPDPRHHQQLSPRPVTGVHRPCQQRQEQRQPAPQLPPRLAPTQAAHRPPPYSRLIPTTIIRPIPAPTPNSRPTVPTRYRAQVRFADEQIPPYSLFCPRGHKIVKDPGTYPKGAIVPYEVAVALRGVKFRDTTPPTASTNYAGMARERNGHAPGTNTAVQHKVESSFRDSAAAVASSVDLSRHSTIFKLPQDSDPRRTEQLASRKHQRPWTLKEWAYVEKIPRGVKNEQMRPMRWEFRDNYGWTPTDGQMRSQYW